MLRISQEINDGSSGVTCPDIDELVSNKKKWYRCNYFIKSDNLVCIYYYGSC